MANGISARGRLRLAAVTVTVLLGSVISTPAGALDDGGLLTFRALTGSTAAGPYRVGKFRVKGEKGSGFNSGTVYFPVPSAEERFGAVIISPGFLEKEEAMSSYGPLIATHGFVVMTFETQSVLDGPDLRAGQMLAALDYLTLRSAARREIDTSRLAVMGFSMGGGAALRAAERRPSLRASIAIAPWHPQRTWESNRSATLIVSGEKDLVAPADTMAGVFYDSMVGVRDRAHLEVRGAAHGDLRSPAPQVTRYTIAWLKRFVEGDRSVEDFLCASPETPTGPVLRYQVTCPFA
ncbi:lipase [Actinocorallia longicatena]|uniref:Poly(ethylene terephthalate) hydrolase n=1 Tax=Actinocorallia longicatena TaxID=111803 RepID=A0ABP6QD18_9ACTN